MTTILAIVSGACSRSTEENVPADSSETYTYRLKLSAVMGDYGKGSTRAEYVWPDGTSLFLQFFADNNRISGTATYSQSDDEWTVTTSSKISSDTDGDCEAYYFLIERSGLMAEEIKLGAETAIYQDTNGSFYLTEDDVMIVKLGLTPKTGRIRFKGQHGVQYAISGVSNYSSYNIKENKFTKETKTIYVRPDGEGDTDYRYLFFSDDEKRQLVVLGEGKSAYLRNFGEGVLATGQSGFISLPSAGNVPANWTLVNIDNLEAITLPTVSDVAVSKLRSHYATVEASVTGAGNGTISETGFIYSTDSDPSETNGIKVACERLMNFSARLSGLNVQTKYYIKAYATNELGTAFGVVVDFTTLSEEEDGSSFGKEGYDEDDDLNDKYSVNGDFGKGGYGDDDNLNDNDSADGNIGKGGFDDDEDWN